MGNDGDLGAGTGVTGTGFDLQQALLNFRHFLTEQLNHEFRCRARQDDGGATQGVVDFHDHGANAISAAQVFLGDHFGAAQTTFNATALDNQIAFVHALDAAHKNLVATGQKVGQQHFSLGVADFLQDHLLGSHGANAADRQRLDAFFDVLAFFNIRQTLFGVHQHLFSVRVLQAGFIGHHQPTAEGFVHATVAVHGHTDVHIAGVQFFGGLGQRRLHSTKHQIALDIFLARDGVYQHEHFAIHDQLLLFSAGLRPLKSTIGASRASRNSLKVNCKA